MWDCPFFAASNSSSAEQSELKLWINCSEPLGFRQFRGASPQGGFPSRNRNGAHGITSQNEHLAGGWVTGGRVVVSCRNYCTKHDSLTLRILHLTAKSISTRS